MSQTYAGSCLCGTVTFEITGPFESFHLCHCSRCRKATATVHASNLFTQPENIRWLSGEDKVTRYELSTAERFARAFCSVCGSGMPYVNRPGTSLVVPAGSLDNAEGLRPDDRIFWKNRAPWHDAVADAPAFDEYPG